MNPNAPQRMTVSISTGSILKTLLVLFLVAALYYLRDIVFIILTAIVVASAIEPSALWFVRRGVPRVVAVVCIYIFLIICTVAFFYLILPPFLSELGSFMSTLPQYITALNIKSSGVGSEFFGWQSALTGLSKSESIGDAVRNFGSSLTTATGSLLSTVITLFGGAVSFVLVVVISFYLSVQDRGVEDFLRLVLPIKHEGYIVNLWHRTQKKIGKWFQGQLILAAIIGVLVFIGLSLLGVKNALLLAFISAVFEIIPVFGPIVGSVPGVLVAFLQGGFTFGLIIAGMYLIIQQIESNVIYPLVVKKLLDIQPLVVIIALVVGLRVGGFLGVLLSVPVAVAVVEYMTDVAKNRITAREKYTNEHAS